MNNRAVALAIAIALALPAEGIRQVAYRDPGGVLSVCYGDTQDIDPTHTYTIAECKSRLDARMLQAVESVERCHLGLPARVLGAFGDAVYNLGPRVACGPGSTASSMLDRGDVAEACKQLLRWDHIRVAGVLVALPGLTERRQKESQVCLQGVNDG